MAEHTMMEAAELVGVGRSTIWRLIKSGKMSGSKNAKDVMVIDSAELFRVFPQQGDETSSNVQVQHEETPSELLKQEIQHLRELIQAKDQIIETQAQALRMLEHKAAPTPIKRWWNTKLW